MKNTIIFYGTSRFCDRLVWGICIVHENAFRRSKIDSGTFGTHKESDMGGFFAYKFMFICSRGYGTINSIKLLNYIAEDFSYESWHQCSIDMYSVEREALQYEEVL